MSICEAMTLFWQDTFWSAILDKIHIYSLNITVLPILMITTITQKYDGENTFVHDAKIEKIEYETFKGRIIEQMIKNVSINGFRKGHAPRDMALKQINPMQLTQTLMQEVVDKYTPEMINSALTQINTDERTVQNVDVDYTPEHTGEKEDGSFDLRLVVKLLPKIDLSVLEKMKVEEPTIADIKDLPPFAEFAQNETDKLLREQNDFEPTDDAITTGYEATVDMSGTVNGEKHDGLTANGMKVVIGAGMFLVDFETQVMGLKKGDTKDFDLTFPDNYAVEMAGKTAHLTVVISEVAKPKYANVAELIENKKEFSETYKSEADFDADVKKVYETRVQNMIDSIFSKRVVEKTIAVVPDFEIDDTLIESETHRILHSMEHEAKDKNQTLGQVLSTSGLSPVDPSVLTMYDDKKVHDEVKEYTRKEIKLVNILSLIYEVRLEQKPAPEEVAQIIEDARKNKQKYNLAMDITDEQIRNIMNDRIIRQYAGNWVVEKAKKNNEILR